MYRSKARKECFRGLYNALKSACLGAWSGGKLHGSQFVPLSGLQCREGIVSELFAQQYAIIVAASCRCASVGCISPNSKGRYYNG